MIHDGEILRHRATEALPVSPALKAAIRDWDAELQALFRPEDPAASDFPSPEAAAAHRARGAALAEWLGREMGAEYAVTFKGRGARGEGAQRSAPQTRRLTPPPRRGPAPGRSACGFQAGRLKAGALMTGRTECPTLSPSKTAGRPCNSPGPETAMTRGGRTWPARSGLKRSRLCPPRCAFGRAAMISTPSPLRKPAPIGPGRGAFGRGSFAGSGRPMWIWCGSAILRQAKRPGSPFARPRAMRKSLRPGGRNSTMWLICPSGRSARGSR